MGRLLLVVLILGLFVTAIPQSVDACDRVFFSSPGVRVNVGGFRGFGGVDVRVGGGRDFFIDDFGRVIPVRFARRSPILVEDFRFRRSFAPIRNTIRFRNGLPPLGRFESRGFFLVP